MATFQTITQFKESLLTGGVAATNTGTNGYMMSMWQLVGCPSHGNVAPSIWENPTNATQGALGQVDATTGKDLWLTSLFVAGLWADGNLVLWDRLLHVGGFDATVTTPQNVNAGADATVSRNYTDGGSPLVSNVGNEIYLEIYTQLGATATTVTCAYKNQAGVAKTTQAVTLGGTDYREAQRFIRLPLAAGDTGVSAVVSITLAASTGVAGSFGLVVAHRLLSFSMASGAPELWTGLIEGDLLIMPGACLFWTWTPRANVTSTDPAFPFALFAFAEK